MFRDSEIRSILSGAQFIARQGVGWREDAWAQLQREPEAHADLSLLYGLLAGSGGVA